MAANFIAKADITIEAPATRVWEALTTPSIIKEYLFGTEAISDWQLGSKLEFRGEYQGKRYHDKGTILQIQPQKLLQYTYWSSMSGLDDSPENYFNVSFDLYEEDGKTNLTVKTENLPNEEAISHSEENWKGVLQKMKEVIEAQTETVKR